MKSSKIIYIVAAALLSIMLVSNSHATSLNQKYKYTISGDKDFGALSIADLSLSAVEAMRHTSNSVFPDSAISDYIFGFTTLYITTINHEVAGHGVRGREFGATDINYEFRLDGSGATSFMIPVDIHPHKDILITLGGIQANYTLSEKIKDRFVDSNMINPIYGAAYIFSRADQAMYTHLSKDKIDGNITGHDINDYVIKMQRFYDENYINKRDVKRAAILDYFDPFLYFSAYAYLVNESFEIPMINCGNFDYLPAARAIFAPYGLEYSLINHIRVKDKYFQVHARYGNQYKHKSYSIGVKSNYVFKLQELEIGGEFVYWNQPELFSDSSKQEKSIQGGLVSIDNKYRLNSNFSITASAGYKTKGFIESRPYDKSFIARIGLEYEL